jgi:hypothetical protein
VWVRCVRGEPELALVWVAPHADRVAEFVIPLEEAVHQLVLSMPASIIVGFEETGHVVSQGANNMVLVFKVEALIDEVVQGDVEASRPKDTASTRALGAEGHAIDDIAFSVRIWVEAGGRRAVIGAELLVGFRPDMANTIKDRLTLEHVEALNGILGVDGISLRTKGAGEVCHDLGATAIAKAILDDA